MLHNQKTNFKNLLRPTESADSVRFTIPSKLQLYPQGYIDGGCWRTSLTRGNVTIIYKASAAITKSTIQHCHQHHCGHSYFSKTLKYFMKFYAPLIVTWIYQLKLFVIFASWQTIRWSDFLKQMSWMKKNLQIDFFDDFSFMIFWSNGFINDA